MWRNRSSIPDEPHVLGGFLRVSHDTKDGAEEAVHDLHAEYEDELLHSSFRHCAEFWLRLGSVLHHLAVISSVYNYAFDPSRVANLTSPKDHILGA